MKLHHRLSYMGWAAAAGLLAGAVVGLAEVLLTIVLGGGGEMLRAAPWAEVAYGLLGLGLGAALGVVLSLVPRGGGSASAPEAGRGAAGLAAAAVLAGLGLLITRYHLYRDLFHESIRTWSVQGLLFNGALLLAFGLLFVLLWWLGRRPAAGRALRPGASLALTGVLLVLAGLAGTVAWPRSALTSAPAGIPPGLEDAPNVILIGVDTLRADRLSCYGYGASQTPQIDALAADGVRYADTTAQASWTKPSFATLFTSLYPSSHTATGKPHRLPQAVTTLAEVLAAGGYHAGGVADNVNIAPVFGFDQGFADYEYLEPDYFFLGNEAASQTALYQVLRRAWAMVSGGRIQVENFYQDAAVVHRHAVDWLAANRGTRFFLFLHYMDPHDPYFAHPYDGSGYARASDQNPDPALAPAFSALYDGEVRYLDGYLGQLFDWLKAEGLYDDALIVLTADHGEEFQEHGGWWHGQTLYQEQIAVPLIVKYPRSARAGTVVTELARSLDVAPTILDVAGLPVPEAMVGQSLWSAAEPPAYAFAEEDHEGNVLQALRTPGHKLIVANDDNPRGLPPQELFDLEADPGEQEDLYAAQSGLATAMSDTLRQVMAQALERAVAAEGGTLDPAVQEQLRNLGY
jgi:arylsulfatase A-like enzyme